MGKKGKSSLSSKWMVIIAIIIGLFFVIVIPIAINEAYKINRGYITVWGGSDVLAYYGSAIGAIGSIVLGWIAIIQTKKANKMSERLMSIEEERYKLEVRPFVMVNQWKVIEITKDQYLFDACKCDSIVF